MTTPDTSAMRAWARENGYEVADRGRLPAEISDAYAAAHGTGGRAAAKPSKAAKATSSKTAPAKATRAVKAPAAAKAATPAKAAPPPDEPAVAAPAGDGTPDGSGPKPSRVADDRRLVALGEQLAALTERVAKLEKAAGNGKDNGKPSRFRRRS